MTPEDGSQPIVKPVMAQFFYMDKTDPTKIRSRIGSVGPVGCWRIGAATGPLQVFATANDLAGQSTGALPYSPRVVAQGGFGVLASARTRLTAGLPPDMGAALDTLVVAGGQGVHEAASNPALVD